MSEGYEKVLFIGGVGDKQYIDVIKDIPHWRIPIACPAKNVTEPLPPDIKVEEYRREVFAVGKSRYHFFIIKSMTLEKMFARIVNAYLNEGK